MKYLFFLCMASALWAEVSFLETSKYDDVFKTIAGKRSILGIDWNEENLFLPPYIDSKRESEIVEAIQKKFLTKSKEKEIEAEKDNPYSAFTIQWKGKPNTLLILKLAMAEISIPIFQNKLKFDRARPSAFNKNISLIVDEPNHSSFPSGHAGQGRLLSLIMSYLDPANAKKYFKQGYELGKNREIGGLHYPSDTLAGFMLAEQVFEKLKSIEEFNQVLNKAKYEWN